MNERDLSRMMAVMDAELAQAEPALPAHPEHTRQIEIMRALSLAGQFRAHARPRRSSARRTDVVTKSGVTICSFRFAHAQ